MSWWGAKWGKCSKWARDEEDGELGNIGGALWPAPGDCGSVTGGNYIGGPWDLAGELGSQLGLVFGEEGRRFVPPFVMTSLLQRSRGASSAQQPASVSALVSRALLHKHGDIFKYSCFAIRFLSTKLYYRSEKHFWPYNQLQLTCKPSLFPLCKQGPLWAW